MLILPKKIALFRLPKKNNKTNQEKNDGTIETKQGEQKNVSKSNKKGKKWVNLERCF